MGLGNIFKKSNKNNQENKLTTISVELLKLLGFNSFDNTSNLIDWVAEHNANLFNVPITTTFDKVNNYLIENDYYDKNWISLIRRSKEGVNGYLIFSYESKLFFQSVNLANRKYDVTGELIEVTIFYQPYTKNSYEVLLYETYKIVDKKIEIERYFYEFKNGKVGDRIKDENFADYILNPKLKTKQTVDEIDYIPIVVMPNKPNEKADCELALTEMKMLDVFYEQLILDVLVNNAKFLFVNIYGNQQAQIQDAVRKLITQNYLFIDEDKPVEILQGNFKGKTLTDVIDWIVTQIAKKIFLYAPGQKKSAQQTKDEVGVVNIATVNAVEQKIILIKANTLKFIKMLIKFDIDVLKSATFGITKKDVTTEKINLEMDIINPRNNQMENEDYGTRQNNIS